uniref:Uncharacterized protein n=1 Tax=Schistosoma curassoni TaxID=6186 RepID=A0A183KTB6_9TREM
MIEFMSVIIRNALEPHNRCKFIVIQQLICQYYKDKMMIACQKY